MNPDGYDFIASCPHCNQKTTVSCNRNQALIGEPVTVASIQCGHAWALTEEERKKLQDILSILAS